MMKPFGWLALILLIGAITFDIVFLHTWSKEKVMSILFGGVCYMLGWFRFPTRIK